MNIKFAAALSLAIYFLTLLFLMLWAPESTIFHPAAINKPLPDLSHHTNSKEKKSAFFGYLRPIVEHNNQAIQQQRQSLLQLQAEFKKQGKFRPKHQRLLAQLKKDYANSFDGNQEELLALLLRRVDTLPPSLVLVQAANESAWGSSRFAREANNLFGQWCFKKGCGIVPANRNANARHEVRKFSSISAAVTAYLKNINTHRAYRELRQIRFNKRRAGEEVTGLALAGGLVQYSERGHDYVNELRRMIKSNNLE